MFNPCNLIKVLQSRNFCFGNLESWALKLGRESKIPNVQRSIQNTKTFWIIPYVHGASEDPSVIIKKKRRDRYIFTRLDHLHKENIEQSVVSDLETLELGAAL